jgi:uncharacterized protein YukE
VARPTDWSPLAAADPVPGDPYEVAYLARQYADTADSITQQAATLRRLSGSGSDAWDSDAGRAFAGHAQSLAGDVEKAHERYATASAALSEWVGELESAQADADAALARAKEAHARQHANAALPPAPAAATPPTEAEQEADRLARARRSAAYDAAGADLSAARRRLDDAVDRYHDAGHRAASKIRDAADHDGLSDGFWDKFTGWVHDHADVIKLITDVAGAIATIAAALTLVLGWVPILGEVLAAVALVATAIQLIGNTLLALSGDGSWLAVGLDLVALASFGAAKLVTRPLEVAAESGTVAGREGSEAFASYMSKADQLDVATKPGTALFYSGGRGAARKAAEEFAEGTPRTTLEQTPGGHWLDAEKIFDRTDLSELEKITVWKQLSSRYAGQATGRVEAFVRNPGPDSVFVTKELPILRQGLSTGRVSSVVIHHLDGGTEVLVHDGLTTAQQATAVGTVATAGATAAGAR